MVGGARWHDHQAALQGEDDFVAALLQIAARL